MKVTIKNATNSVTYNVKYLAYGKGHNIKSADCSYVEDAASDYEYVALYITDNDRIDIRLEEDTQIIITKS